MQPPTHPEAPTSRAPARPPRSRAAARAARTAPGRVGPDRALEDRLLATIGRYLKTGELPPA